ncbi:ArnT family glycosyltransferase [Roseospira goensis]|uniref:Glycosyltransferase RgtA/B/C/D-like domain-containing protein n=1 Tax=Roseospira goensis TaxID=391922 RepID=A0A7W6S2M4_9PROT|nr:glycosyltransferase family 39 protein [Roseospira goensis]MBB4287763.1 hypothetical protein [Roseospira goensis]
MTALLARTAAPGRPFDRPRPAFGAVLLLLAGVVALQVGLQTGGRNDDAELLLFSQSLALGYDPLNPPLVVWLHGAVAQVLGPTLLSTRVLIAALLFAAYPLAWAATRQLTSDRAMATLAGLSLAGLVAWNWAPHLNLSHTVAMTTASFALLWAVLRLLARPDSWRAWLLAGLIAGLGLLTKYNFALVLLAVVLAGLTTPTTRRVLLGGGGRLAAAAGVTFVVAAPHYLWLVTQGSALIGLVDAKLGRDAPQAGAWDGIASGLATLGEHAAMVLLPAVAVALLVFAPALWRALRWPLPVAPVTRDRLVFAALVPVLVFGQLAALVLLAGVTEIGPHHVYPLILVVVPLFAALARGRPGPTSRGLFALVMGLLMLAVPLFLARFIVTTAATCEAKCNTALPYAAYAAQVQEAGFTGGTVVLLGRVHHLPLEHLRPHLPAHTRLLRTGDPQKSDFVPPRRGSEGDCLVLWPAERAPAMAQRLRDTGIPGLDATLPTNATLGVATGTLALSGRPAPDVGYALVPGGIGRCR